MFETFIQRSLLVSCLFLQRSLVYQRGEMGMDNWWKSQGIFELAPNLITIEKILWLWQFFSKEKLLTHVIWQEIPPKWLLQFSCNLHLFLISMYTQQVNKSDRSFCWTNSKGLVISKLIVMSCDVTECKLVIVIVPCCANLEKL